MSNALSWLLSLTGFVLVAYAMLDSACFAIYGPLRPAQGERDREKRERENDFLILTFTSCNSLFL